MAAYSRFKSLKRTSHGMDCVCVCLSCGSWIMQAWMNGNRLENVWTDPSTLTAASGWILLGRQITSERWHHRPASSPLFSSPLLPSSHLCNLHSTWHSTAVCTPREKKRQGSRWQKNWDKVQSGAEWIDLKEDKMDGWRREGWLWHLIFIHCRLHLWEPTACV